MSGRVGADDGPAEIREKIVEQQTSARVVVTGASGNIGSQVLDALQAHERTGSVVAVARRPPPDESRSKVEWKKADVSSDDLAGLCRDADALVHLAWQIQPSWDVAGQRRTNVEGSRRVFAAAAAAAVPTLVHASSVGAYAAGPKDRLVDEKWRRGGHAGHPYSLQKAEVEDLLDGFEVEHAGTRVVRLRPCLVFQAAAGQEVRRYFLPRHMPGALLRPSLLARNPACFQVVHAKDVAAAFVAAVFGDASGAFNIATVDVIGGRALPFLEAVVRPVVWASWRLHLQPVDPGWVRLLFRSPLIDPSRAREVLGWVPRHSGQEAFAEGVRAMADPPPPATPALAG